MSSAALLLCALLLDAALGEPKWLWSRLPHPAVLMGNLIAWADTRFNTNTGKRAKGILVVLALCTGAWLLGYVLSLFGALVQICLAAILLAQKSLVQHVAAVADALHVSVPEGRAAVAMIVGRDTETMNETAIARSAIESAAENLSDGVLAPAFWFFVAGLPGLLLYKIINTADSMIGYRTERHAEFGWAAARLDDLLNLIPARLTAIVLALSHGMFEHWPSAMREARKHRSPNAGWPEAAMARVLGVALSGPRSYEGELRDFPFVNPHGRRTISARTIEDAVRALWVTWGALFAFVFVLWLLGF